MTKVKICGITNLDDALVSARFGANAIGFNFHERSPRYVSPEQAREIGSTLPKEIQKVGVFVNDSVEKVLSIVETANLDAVQVHGDETAEFIDALRRVARIRIIKALRVGPDFHPLEAFDYKADAVLLDAYSPDERGGTGKVFDWEIALAVARAVDRLYLAGGLNPDNVAEAIETVRPYAVDVASGVESEPGKKDFGKLEAFIMNAKGA